MILAVQGFKEYLAHDYRTLMDVLREMPRVAESLDLTVETLPHFSTVCARKQAIPMKRWRAILDASVKLYELGDVQAIDATGVDRVQASQHYAKWTDYTFEAVKTTLLLDCETSAILPNARFSVLSTRFSVGIGTVSDRLEIEFMPRLASVFEDIIGRALVVVFTDDL